MVAGKNVGSIDYTISCLDEIVYYTVLRPRASEGLLAGLQTTMRSSDTEVHEHIAVTSVS